MNLLIIGTTDILGGAAKVSWDIKDFLEKHGHTVSMFVADKRSTDPQVKVIPRIFWQKLCGLIFATDSYIDSDWLLDTPEFKAADIVHCHNLHGRYFNLATLQKMSLRKPVVWTLHDEWAITPHCAYTLEGTTLKNGFYVCPSLDTQPRLLWDNTEAITKERERLYLSSRLQVVTPSLWLKKRTEKTPLGTQPIHYIPNGINVTDFTKTDSRLAREKLNLPQDKKIILFLATAGKANTWKGWKYTEEVITHYTSDPNIIFLNVGGFSAEQHPEENVIYRNHVNNPSELALYYSAADALLFTSIADNFPLVILEAMSCGLPIIAFNVGGVPEVLTHLENGFVGRYKNTEDLIAGITWLCAQNPDDLAALSDRSREKIRSTYTTAHMTEAYYTLYKNLLTPS
jgi:glycosyltransferase involved in cell wall biosynthesis